MGNTEVGQLPRGGIRSDANDRGRSVGLCAENFPSEQASFLGLGRNAVLSHDCYMNFAVKII